MDPNATLQMIHEFLTDRKAGDEVDEWCYDLKEWLDKGGFEPNWEQYPLGTSYYNCRKRYSRRPA